MPSSSSLVERTWRLLGIEAHDGATNLAIDEAVALAVAAGQALPTLRLYTWSEPCIALGSFQPLADLAADARDGRGPAVVRRTSGGTMVMHDEHHLGLSVAVPPGHALGPSDVLEAYRRLNSMLVAALESLGVAARLLSVEEARADRPDPLLRAACYGGVSPFEIVARGRKLVGSAQVRRRGLVLHEAGILLRFDAAETAKWLAASGGAESLRRTALLRERVTDLESELRRPVGLEEVAEVVTMALGPALGTGPPEHSGLTECEVACAAELRRVKYAERSWTCRR